MKFIYLILFTSLLTSACNSGGDDKKTVSSSGDLSKNPDYQKGVALVAKNKCMICHSIEQAVQGPAYRDVANKYASYPDTIVSHLAKKIITGGSGVWGEISMTPHPEVSQEDAETMVKYILLLKK